MPPRQKTVWVKKPNPTKPDDARQAYIGVRTTLAMHCKIKQAAKAEQRSISQWMEIAATRILDMIESGDDR